MLSKRTVLLLIFAVILLSLAVRYPLVEHERYQADSYYIHLLSQGIVSDGYAKWTFHPLSYFGYYPVSYPSGGPFIIAEFSLVTGMSVELTILVLSNILGVMFCLTAFCLSRELLHNVELVTLATLLAALGPRLVDTTYWVGSARGLVAVLLILLVMTLLRAGSMRSRVLLTVGLVFAFASFATHHMAILLVFFGLAYLIAIVLSRLFNRLHGRSKMSEVILAACGILFVCAITGLSQVDFVRTSLESTFGESSVFDLGHEVPSVVFNMGIIYANQIGIVALFAVLYVPRLLRSKRLTVRSALTVSVPIAFMPILSQPFYVSIVILPFVSVMGVSWFAKGTSKKLHKKLVAASIFILIVASAALPVMSIVRWNSNEYLSGDTIEVAPQVFNDATYIMHAFEHSYALSNSEVLSHQLAAISRVPFMIDGVPAALSSDIDQTSVTGNVSWSNTDFPVNLYVWFDYSQQRYIYFAWSNLMFGGIKFLSGTDEIASFARDYLSRHTTLVVVLDNELESEFAGRWSILPSEFVDEVRESEWLEFDAYGYVMKPLPSYAIYRSERISSYVVGLPL